MLPFASILLSQLPPAARESLLAALATLPGSTPAPPPQAAPPEVRPPARRRRKRGRQPGRPTLLTDQVVNAMYDAIYDHGVSDCRAGSIAQVGASTVSRWKRENPAFAEFLQTARDRFEMGQIKKVVDARFREPRSVPRISTWLLQVVNPERRARCFTRPPAAVRRALASAPPRRRQLRKPGASENAQQSKNVQNIAEIHPPQVAPNSTSVGTQLGTQNSERETPASAATQQSKNTQNIAEIHPPQVAPNSTSVGTSLGTRNSEPETPASAATHQSKNTQNIAEIPPPQVAPNSTSVATQLCTLSSLEAPPSAATHQSKNTQNIAEIPPPQVTPNSTPAVAKLGTRNPKLETAPPLHPRITAQPYPPTPNITLHPIGATPPAQ